MPIQRLTHLGICVSDLERSVRFYRDVLECEEIGRLDLEGGHADTVNSMEGVHVRAVYLERDGWRIELIEFAKPGCIGEPEPRPMNQLGLTHLSFRVDDLDAVCEKLEEAGGSLLADTRVGDATSPVRVIMGYDPDGVRFELIQGPGDPNALPGSASYMRGR